MKKLVELKNDMGVSWPNFWIIFPFLLLVVGAMAIYALTMESQEKWRQFKSQLDVK